MSHRVFVLKFSVLTPYWAGEWGCLVLPLAPSRRPRYAGAIDCCSACRGWLGLIFERRTSSAGGVGGVVRLGSRDGGVELAYVGQDGLGPGGAPGETEDSALVVVYESCGDSE